MKLAIFLELLTFLWERKKFVLAPIVLILLLMALFIMTAEIPALAPFIYAIF